MASRRLYKKRSPYEEEGGEKRELEQKNSARTIVFQQGPIYIPLVSSDWESMDVKGICLVSIIV